MNLLLALGVGFVLYVVTLLVDASLYYAIRSLRKRRKRSVSIRHLAGADDPSMKTFPPASNLKLGNHHP